MKIHPGASLITLLGVAALLEATRPVSVDAPLTLRIPLSSLVFVGASTVLSWAIRSMHRERAEIEPNREPSTIVTTGPYRFSRNPMYVGNILILLSFTFLTASAWFLLATVIQFSLLTAWVIPAEEERLRRAFPSAADQWFEKTGRWF